MLLGNGLLGVKYVPLKHQSIMVHHLMNHSVSALFVGMGLGKTGAVLKTFTELKKTGKARGMLVVAPLRVSEITWFDEVEKWDHCNSLRIVSLRTREGVEAFHRGDADIYTINYESLPRVCKNLFTGRRELPFDTIVLDESDNCKNPSSVRIKELRRHIHKIPRRWAMTGTPVSNNYLDLFAQIRILDDGARFGKFHGKWRDKYFVNVTPHATYATYELNPMCEGMLEKAVADISLVLPAEKYLKIPPVRVVDVPVVLPPNAKKIYKSLQRDLLAALENDKEVVAVTAAVLVNKLLQVTSGAVYATDERDPSKRTVEHIHSKKIDALAKVVKDNPGEPILVFCQYLHEKDRIMDKFPQAEVFREGSLKRWNAKKIPILIAHPKSIGHGLNAQDGGHIIVWFSLGYSRALYDQSNARLARFGQKHETIIYRIICNELVDEAVIASLENKDSRSKHFLNTIMNIKRLKKVS